MKNLITLLILTCSLLLFATDFWQTAPSNNKWQECRLISGVTRNFNLPPQNGLSYNGTGFSFYATNNGLYSFRSNSYGPCEKTVDLFSLSSTINNWSITNLYTDFSKARFDLIGKAVYDLYLVRKTDASSAHGVTQPQVDDINGSIGLAATSDGVYKANYNLDSWSHQGINCAVYNFVAIENEIYAATATGLYKSTDNGSSWNLYAFTGNVVNCVVKKGLNSLYVGTSNGVFYSNPLNSGTVWWSKVGGLDYPVKTITAMDDGTVWAGTARNGLYSSVNGTDNFTFLALSGKCINSIAAGKISIGSTSYYSVGTSNGLFYSTDKLQWTNVLTNSPVYLVTNSYLRGSTVLTSQGYYFYNTQYYENSWQWYNQFKGFGNRIASYELGQMLLAGNGISLINSSCQISEQLVTPNYKVKSLVTLSDKSVLFSGINGNVTPETTKLYKFSKSGGLQIIDQVGLPSCLIEFIVCNGDKIFASIGNKLYLSINGGSNWTLVTTTMTNIVSLTIKSNGLLIAGLAGGSSQVSNGKVFIYNSNNGNQTYSANLWLSNTNVALNANSNCIFAGGDGLFTSVDNGQTWIRNNFAYPVKSIVLNGNIVAINTGSEIYYSRNNGSSWQLASNTIGNSSVNVNNIGAIFVNSSNYLFAAGDNGFIPLRSINSLTNGGVIPDITDKGSRSSNLSSENFVTTTALNQNYPNPFNPETTISFALANQGKIALTVYNAKGEMVAELVNEVRTAGNHSVKFNAAGMNSGVYFYKLTTPERSMIQKMLLVK